MEVNARDADGLVHSCERFPELHAANAAHCTAPGFTWCMAIFTWVDGPRFHPVTDEIELRLERTSEHVTCFECIAPLVLE